MINNNVTKKIQFENNIVEILKRLEIPGNAAKIYIYLLKNGEQNGYSISKHSGINNSVIYRELERLKKHNFINEIGIKNKTYQAINSHALLKLLKDVNKNDELVLEESLSLLLSDSNSQINVKINKYDDLIIQIINELHKSKEEVLIRVWDEEYRRIKETLETLNDNQIKIKILSFTPLKSKIGEVYCYNIDPNKFQEHWKRGIAISIDKKIVIVGNKIGKHPIQGLICNDSLITESIRDQIILDIELAKHRLKT